MTPQAYSHEWQVYGHDWAVDHLRKSLTHDRVRHAYLIAGAESVGKETLARAFAMALNCTHADNRPCAECSACQRIQSGNHPDVIYSQRDSETSPLKIEELRSVMQRLALKPFEARHRIAIFRDFDSAQPRAQDALLKTLEEPAPHAILILLARSLEPILPTIASRSQLIHLRPASATTIEQVLVERFDTDEDQAHLLAHISGGRVGWALSALHDPDLLERRASAFELLESVLAENRVGRFKMAEDLAREKSALLALLELWMTFWRDLVLLCEGSQIEPTNVDRIGVLRGLANRVSAADALAALETTRDTLGILSTNANVRLALEVMFLNYPYL